MAEAGTVEVVVEQRYYREPGREVPVARDVDVVVCGGGPAGVSAAIASARAGARTVLLEVHGCLGGVWTAGLLSWILDSGNKSGVMAEITSELERRGARAPHPSGGTNFAYDAEQMKLLLEEMCVEAGVIVQLHTRVVAAGVSDSPAGNGAGRRLETVVTESKSGRQAWRARAFVDGTGDGDLAAQAGCGFDLGHPETGQVQPMSLMALVSGVRAEQVMGFLAGGLPKGAAKTWLLQEMRRAGLAPSYEGPTLFRIHDDLLAFMTNHEYGVSALDAGQITAATIRARAEVRRLVAGLRALGGVWKEMRIVATGAQIGVREGRRIHGRYTVTLQDMLEGLRRDDAVCRATFGIDVHSPDPAMGKRTVAEYRRSTQPYDIPLRALIARDVDGLVMAGRCISGDFLAHSSYRVTGNAVAMGEAAGTTAALAALRGILPHEVPPAEVVPRELLPAS